VLVLHATWSDDGLGLWAESLEAYRRTGGRAGEPASGGGATATLAAPRAAHPFTVSADGLGAVLIEHGLLAPHAVDGHGWIRLSLPSDERGPWPSDRLGSSVGPHDTPIDPVLREWRIETVRLATPRAIAQLLRLEDHGSSLAIEYGYDVRYWIVVARFILELLADQRFVPTIMQGRDQEFRAAWLPWLHDEVARRRVAQLIAGMPPVVRAVRCGDDGDPWRLIDGALRALADATIRRGLTDDDYPEAIEGRDPAGDAQVAWLAGLLGGSDGVDVSPVRGATLIRDVARWVGRLDETGGDRSMQIGFRLHEPVEVLDEHEMAPIPDDITWRLAVVLRAEGDPPVTYEAEDVWRHAASGDIRPGVGGGQPQELLLTELRRAARIYPKVDDALAEMAPSGVDLTTDEAYAFLRDFRPLLEESGFTIDVPEWWDEPRSRLGARLRIEAPELDAVRRAGGGTSGPGSSVLGLRSLVRFDWQVAIGDEPLSLEEFERLARQSVPLLRVRGRWVELRPEEIASAMRVLREEPHGEMTVLEAIRIAYGAEDNRPGLPVFGLDATGWVDELLRATNGTVRAMPVDQPKGFHGELRPYQQRGLGWLVFLDGLGLGACLADDMGLGKTIELIALLLHEREQSANPEDVGPTLLIVPTSLIANWTRELERFAPSLRSRVHHGPDRPTGEAFEQAAHSTDVVITTYGLVTRDCETLLSVTWGRVVLDEAQYIKNPPTKQTTAIRGLRTSRRVALTGTPVENRLSELWSIMEFCNPGYLGAAGEFRRHFGIPIERHRDREQARRLKALIQPFVLRRLKTDPTVIDDLPDCFETKEYATLTKEQATLYQNVVDAMMRHVDRAQGIQRRGLVLSTLVELKQICKHPAQFLREIEAAGAAEPAPLVARSGKCRRLLKMLEEVLATGDRALVFTQFRQMGHLLRGVIQHHLDCDALFMHGGTPQVKRQQMIDRFQDPDGGVPVFVLSLKAGGVGLNLTAANHVFHFDRWWNPAVENQATDRAFRIGQMRTVHVHKFVCVGTLEERIDQMIEQKIELAEQIVGAGESWLTELSTGQLRDLLALRTEAMETDA
jgi:hypothetical protein